MSLDTAQTTAGGPLPPPNAQAQPAPVATARVKARRRPWVFALMAALVAAGALGTAFAFTSVNDTQEVLVVSSDIKRGEIIEAGDLAVVRVSVDPALTPVPGSQKAELEGSRAAVDLWAGTLLSEQAVTDNLGQGLQGEPAGLGLFGVELFVKGDQVWFSEVSPRPHDTGLVTLVTQWQSEFELHARAILGLPVDAGLRNPGAAIP